MKHFKRQSGFGILEVVITISIVSLVVMSVGKTLSSVYRLYTASNYKSQAYALAQAPIELINNFKNDYFGCSCAGTCTTCIRASDGQQCNPIGIYTSCWTPLPVNLTTAANYYLVDVGGGIWELRALASGVKESVPLDINYQREIIIESLTRDGDGNINASGTNVDYNTKKITVKVYWQERGQTRSVSLSTIITAWENI